MDEEEREDLASKLAKRAAKWTVDQLAGIRDTGFRGTTELEHEIYVWLSDHAIFREEEEEVMMGDTVESGRTRANPGAGCDQRYGGGKPHTLGQGPRGGDAGGNKGAGTRGGGSREGGRNGNGDRNGRNEKY